MRKYWVRLLTALILAAALLVGCGSANTDPEDLTGKWTAEHEEGASSYMTATINSTSIHVYFYTPDGDTSALYWSGTYVAPTEPTEDGCEYTWTSEANHDETDKALLASSDDTKQFTYKDGDLSFPISMMGVQSTIHMKRSTDQTSASEDNSSSDNSSSYASETAPDNNTETASESVSDAVADSADDASNDTTESDTASVPSISSDVNDAGLELGRYGLFVHNSQYSDNYYIEYAAEITNTGENYAVEFPKLQVTFENEDGAIATTDTQTGFYVMPGDTVVLSSQISVPKDSINENTRYGFTASGQDSVKASSLQIPKSSDFSITNVNESTSDGDTRITGKLSYTYSQSINDMIAITALGFRGDDIVGIATTYIDAPPAGQETAFQIGSSAFPDHDDLQVYAQVW